MAPASVVVIAPGMLTTIQDRGRWGYQTGGVPVAGPMDPRAHRLANALVGNDWAAATLEITFVGPELEFEDERIVAVVGAEFDITVDGRLAPANAPFTVAAGSRLRVGHRRRGARAYLAVRGGLDVPVVLGSRATHVVSAMGGFNGRPLRVGDRVPLGPPDRARRTAAALADPWPLGEPPALMRVLPGPHVEAFTADALDTLESAPYVIGPLSDRMGFRLDGPRLQHSRGADMISDATPLGVLQVPASGQPILLMADRQTTGGYPMLATVITADIAVAGQLGPGDALRFSVCTRLEAVAALIAQERALMAVEDAER